MRFVWIKAAAAVTVAAAMAAAMAVAVAVAVAVVVVVVAAAAIRYQHINTRRTGVRQMLPPWSPPVPRGTARHRSL